MEMIINKEEDLNKKNLFGRRRASHSIKSPLSDLMTLKTRTLMWPMIGSDVFRSRHVCFFLASLPGSRTDDIDIKIGHVKFVPSRLLRYGSGGSGGSISGPTWPTFRFIFTARSTESTDKVQIIGQPIAQRFAATFGLAGRLLNIVADAVAGDTAADTGARAGVAYTFLHH